MFNPAKVQKAKNDQNSKKKALKNVKDLCLSLIPPELQDGLLLDVNEQVCGDPTCSPVDTVITLVWQSGGRGIFGVPLEAKEVTLEDLESLMPDADVLGAWKNGQDAEWPRRPPLRFELNTRVECRVGPNAKRDWAPGTIVKLHYSEPNWPVGASAPYQIRLDDGRLIYAPQDVDQVIRLLGDGSGAPPLVNAPNDDEEDEDYEDVDEEDEEDEGKR